jgi:L-fuconolactonase
MRIDAHQHFWNYTATDYPWISVGSALHRDYGPTDLAPCLDEAGIGGCIAVQARQSLVENQFLCDLAAQHSIVRGVVGWIDLRSNEVSRQAEAFANRNKAVGVRHVVQDEADPDFMAGQAFRRGIACLRDSGLVYDILIYAHQLPNAIRLVRDFPDQSFVLDHVAKPRIRDREIHEWTRHMKQIAESPNVVVKLSGMVTEASWSDWTIEQLTPYWEVVAEAFGPIRILFGSDWPVIRLAAEYARWVNIVQSWLADWTETDRELVWGGNAARVYRLSES